ncbi:hypothetical protein LTR37_016368 [Vermiconidia calcicola]|uniref:Uncharacterized protein n=1 Tax=Vermiconidia calcicola TaxID=1690605 RepID=A0ACC3MN27_9PEZI|nr:hypothetical protein LTR37_016368 [Vermiconidia calcicola]
MFRAMTGIASALTFPSAISIISKSVEGGKRRNIGFATLGLAMPLGFSFGLVLGGVLLSGPGWRVGYYIMGAVSFLMFAIGICSLPTDVNSSNQAGERIWTRLATEIDWIGAGVASVCLALLSYVLAVLSGDINNIKDVANIALLAFSVLLMPVFVMWMHHREKAGKPALIPNTLWNNKSFTSVCIMVLLSNAVVNCMELFSSLFFQEVQHLSALQASIRILPSLVVGVILNFMTGALINKVPAIYTVLISSSLCAGAPVLMAVIEVEWPYWYSAFFAQLLAPLSIDILFTVGILVVSDVFPQKTQALGGAVFNTVSQLGTSFGLTIMSVISQSVTEGTRGNDKTSQQALMDGYRAGFWTLFAWMLTACVVGAFGLRKLGKVGEKRD